MTDNQIEHLEIDLLLETIYQRYGYDFRSYARASIERRIKQFMSGLEFETVSELIPRIIRDEVLFSELLQYFSISVTDMFRDPFVYRVIREEVVPILRTWPHIKIWHAGCATGEEVYSLAIILKEEGIYDKSIIYATDLNDAVLEKAKEGIYSPKKIQEATRNYQKTGGRAPFGNYYHARYDAVLINGDLKERITFANHNLATDGVFGEMHLIFCRNVLIYFNSDLQNRAVGLFVDSLAPNGFLCIGTKESLEFTRFSKEFVVVDDKAKIYKKKDSKF